MFKAPFGNQYRTPWVMLVVSIIGMSLYYYLQSQREYIIAQFSQTHSVSANPTNAQPTQPNQSTTIPPNKQAPS
jgi:hypothetical protein